VCYHLFIIIVFIKDTHIKTRCKIITALKLSLKTQLSRKYNTSKTHNQPKNNSSKTLIKFILSWFYWVYWILFIH